jgi:hypothetical protein
MLPCLKECLPLGRTAGQRTDRHTDACGPVDTDRQTDAFGPADLRAVLQEQALVVAIPEHVVKVSAVIEPRHKAVGGRIAPVQEEGAQQRFEAVLEKAGPYPPCSDRRKFGFWDRQTARTIDRQTNRLGRACPMATEEKAGLEQTDRQITTHIKQERMQTDE